MNAQLSLAGRLSVLVALVSLSLSALACSSPPERAALRADGAQSGAGLGKIDFPNSGPRDAQEPFVRGVLLLHSFEYQDAAEAFRQAEERAPRFALAYWGEALTHCHPIWQEEDRDAARAVLAKLAPSAAERAELAGDERERALLASVETLFGEGTRAERARAYCAELEALHARYPDDLEIAAFHSLAILGTATQGRDLPTYMRAAAEAEQVLERAPDHPGALHYAIHSYDDPVHAPLGLRMARRYGVVAAAAEHALHMPSHIYVALGMWPESVEANVAASAAADARRAAKALSIEARGFHSLAWLAYSHLQLGNTAEAERLLTAMVRDEAESHSKRTRGSLVQMRAAHVVALDAWTGEHARFDVDVEGLDPAQACAELYVRGRRALAASDLPAARTALAAMEPHRGALESLVSTPAGAAQCCTSDSKKDYLPGRKAARVMELELSGLIALHSGAREEGMARLAAAAEAEDQMGYDFGPPAVVEPAHELLGYLWLELGRNEDARAELERALVRAPGRAKSAKGVAKASGQE